jgi:hypothetical protein
MMFRGNCLSPVLVPAQSNLCQRGYPLAAVSPTSDTCSLMLGHRKHFRYEEQSIALINLCLHLIENHADPRDNHLQMYCSGFFQPLHTT